MGIVAKKMEATLGLGLGVMLLLGGTEVLPYLHSA